MLKDDESGGTRSLNKAITWLKHFLQANSFQYCVIWKLGDDPSRFIEWMDCCCGAGYGHVNDESEAKSISTSTTTTTTTTTLCKDDRFQHLKRSKACEALADLPSSLSLYSGIHGDVAMSNQPKWIQDQGENGTRVYIPIIGGLIELHYNTSRIQDDNKLVGFIADQCNFYSKQEPVVFIQTTQMLDQNIHTQKMLPSTTLSQSNHGSSIGSTTPPKENSSPELASLLLSSPIFTNQEHDVNINKSLDGKSYISKNLQLERNRRNRIRGGLFALRALVPNISKMDRASIIGDAIEYIGELQRNVKALQDELEELNDESKKTLMKGAQDCIKYPVTANHSIVLPKVSENKTSLKIQMEVNQMGPKIFSLRLIYEHKRGRFTKLMEGMSSLGLQVVECNATTMDGKVLNVFKVQANKEIPLKKLKDALIKLLT